MPPVMNRASSNARCRQAWELRCRGRTWQEIADTLGYKDRHNAHNAIRTWLEKNPPDELAVMRRATGQRLIGITNDLLDSLDEAKEAGDHQAVATLARAAIDALDRHAKLTGQHIPVATEVNVNVNTAQALADTRARLLETIDAEYTEQPALPAAVEAQP